MKRLHELTGISTAWLWGYVFGRNGRAITPVPNHTYEPYRHLYEMQRGENPWPIGGTTRWASENRAYWQPWNTAPSTVEARLTPLCGRLRTASQQPRFSFSGLYGTDELYRCPRCIQRAAQRGIIPSSRTQLVGSDPWTAIPRNERMHTPDPINGR